MEELKQERPIVLYWKNEHGAWEARLYYKGRESRHALGKSPRFVLTVVCSGFSLKDIDIWIIQRGKGNKVQKIHPVLNLSHVFYSSNMGRGKAPNQSSVSEAMKRQITALMR